MTRLDGRRDGGHPHAEEAPAEGPEDPRDGSRLSDSSSIVDAGRADASQEWRAALDLDAEPRIEDFPALPGHGRDALRPPLHLGHDRSAEGALSTSTARLVSQYLTAKWVLDLQPDDVYWCNADPGWVTGTSYGIIGPWSNGVTQAVLDSGFGAERWYSLHREAARDGLVLGADRHPPPHARGTAGRPPARPLLASPPRERRRAAQPRGGSLVARGVRPPVPRHLLADRDRLHRHLELPGHADQGRLDGQAVPRHHGGGPRSEDVRAVSRRRGASASSA